jgi:hypothetical protein
LTERRGTVWIGPSTLELPSGRLVDPATARFWVSWQDDELLEDDEVAGAEAAIAWGRERAERVLIRLGHNGPHYAAGEVSGGSAPSWPPETPPEGWFTP